MSRRRRKLPVEESNRDRWLVSYADFVTLLFAFFVVMYSISAVNDDKYKAFSDSLEAAFYDKKQILKENDLLKIAAHTPPLKAGSTANPGAGEISKILGWAEEKQQLTLASEQLTVSLRSLIDENMVSVKRNDYWIELELNSGILFLSGEAELSASSIPIIKKIAHVFKILTNAINVEGHTDNNPINTLKFPSNWELSSARATRVVQEFVKEGIDPARLSATGYGEFHPVADNKIEAGRFKNRRVVLLLMSRGFSRYGASDQDRVRFLKQLPDAVLNGSDK